MCGVEVADSGSHGVRTINEMKPIGLKPDTGSMVSTGSARLMSHPQLRDYIRMIWRHRKVVLGTVLLLTGLATVLVFQMTPRYKAEALIMIAPPQTRVVKFESVLSGLPYDQDRINSEIAILTSRQLADRMVRKAKLVDDPEFNRALANRRGLMGWIDSLFQSKSKSLTANERKIREKSRVVNNLLKVIVVKPRYQSRVIAISVTSTNATKSAKLTKLLVDLYLVEQLEAKFEAIQRASAWLGGRILALRAAVEKSERAVEAYRQRFGLIKGKEQETAAASRITNLNNQLVLARVKRAEAEARLSELQRLVKSRRGVGSVSAVQSSKLIQSLRLRESAVIGKIAELSAEYGRKHPKMIAARAELADLRLKITQEVQKIVIQVRGEVLVARAREEALRKSLKALEAEAGVLNRASVGLRTLEREAEANRMLLKAMLSRLKETSSQSGIQTPDARLISRPVTPTHSYFPREVLFIFLAFGGSIVVGLGIASLREHMDSGFRSSDQVEQLTGLPALGLVPTISNNITKRDGIAQYLVKNPLSPFAEAVRNIHVSLALSNVDNPPKRILVTSAMAEEGKSSTAYALARVAAMSGKKVVLVDCDLRRPSAHRIHGTDASPGLVDVLAGDIELSKAIRWGHENELSILAAGECPPNPSDLLMSERMKALLDSLSEAYDLVIIDSAPVMAVSDPRVLAPRADVVLFVARWARTNRENVTHSIKQLTDNGARVAGVALTRVDVRKHSQYGYGDSGYYDSRYSAYYTS